MRFLSLALAISFVFAETLPADERFESRLNELMLWRLSDELELKPQEEMSLKSILSKYKNLRKGALDAQETALKKIETTQKAQSSSSSSRATASQAATCPSCLKEYETATKQLPDANAKEFAELRALLGPQRLERFLVIRRRMTLDVREALRQMPSTQGAVGTPTSTEKTQSTPTGPQEK